MSTPVEATPEPAVVLAAEGLTKDYGRRRVVDGLDLSVQAGQVYGFLGRNGAGKSTTIRMLLGLISPTAGEARLLGEDVRRRKVKALKAVGAQVETPAFYGYLSGYRNLELLSALTAPTSRQEILDVLERVKLKGREHDKVRTYSQGMRMRLGLAQALLPQPQLVILDEPTNGLDPYGMKEVRELVAKLAREDGLTVFLSSHILSEVQQVCDRVAVIDEGRLVAEGRVDQLLADGAVARVQLECDRREDAAALARELDGVDEVELRPDGLLVTLPEERVAELNCHLVTGGIAVRALVPERVSLEEFFLRVTGGSSA